MDSLNSRSSDFGPLTGPALELLCEKFGLVQNWTGPEITAERGTYKLDWHNQSDGIITLYDDGVAQYYDDDEQLKETKIIPLHDRQWVEKLTSKGVVGVVAIFAVEFFKELKKAT